jgi:hypothetical protein
MLETCARGSLTFHSWWMTESKMIILQAVSNSSSERNVSAGHVELLADQSGFAIETLIRRINAPRSGFWVIHLPQTSQGSLIDAPRSETPNRLPPCGLGRPPTARAMPRRIRRLVLQLARWMLSSGRRSRCGLSRGTMPQTSHISFQKTKVVRTTFETGSRLL